MSQIIVALILGVMVLSEPSDNTEIHQCEIYFLNPNSINDGGINMLIESYSGETLRDGMQVVKGGVLRLCRPLKIERTDTGITVTRTTYYGTKSVYFFQLVPRASSTLIS